MSRVVDLISTPASPFLIVEKWADLMRDLHEVPMLSWQARHVIFSPGNPLPDPRPVFPSSPRAVGGGVEPHRNQVLTSPARSD